MPVYLGIDIGSLTTKIVLLDEDGQLSTGTMRSGYSGRKVAEQMTLDLLAKRSLTLKDVGGTVATGYGRITYPADREVSEITCQGKGIFHLYPKARTIIDIGGQDSKVIRLLSNGKVSDFAMNDKCAAGTGRFLEVMAETMEVPIQKVGDMALRSSQVCKISSFCTVFAESEVITYLSQGASQEDILAGVCASVANRVATMVERTGIEEEVVFTGGVSLNHGVSHKLSQVIGKGLVIPKDPQITAALGAALFAKEFYS